VSAYHRLVAVLALVRHGRTDANAAGTLAGWTPGVALDETGRAQADELAARLAEVPLVRVVASPLERCRATAEALLARREVELRLDDRLGEVHYGDWTGRPLSQLSRTALWRVVQDHPSAVVFPGPDGESLAAMAARAVDAVREHDRAVEEVAGPDGVWVAVTHGDVVKAVLADALGMHLDAFQRIVVDPGSVSVVRYTDRRPFVLRTNDTGGSLGHLRPRRRRRRGRRGDAVVGGGAEAGA
jgi:probable phosphomutase (TIGR03848 family)